MRKDKVKTILIVLIVLILCLNVWVYAAYVLSATDVNYTKSNGTTVSVKTALDELYTKVPTHEIGDEVTVGGEQFYVLEWDNNSDVALLMTKNYLHNNERGNTFSSYPTYWSSSFSGSPFNLNDFIGFDEKDVMGKTKSYGRSKGAVASRLLSYEEAYALNSKRNSNNKIATMLRRYGILVGFCKQF